jgi:6-phospho-beta-glucosidase
MAEAWATADPGVIERRASPNQGPGEEGYAAVAVDFLRTVAGAVARQLILNTANRGRLEGIANDEVVEITCSVSTDGARPRPGPPLPTAAAARVARIKEVERLTLRAAETGSAAFAVDALAAHPVVPSRDVAERIWSAYVDRHDSLRMALR